MHTAIARPVEHVAERLKVWDPNRHSRPRAQTNLCVQSGADINPSMVSKCLENLEDLGEKGVDMEVICNTAGVVYVGGSCFAIICYHPNHLLQQCQILCVSLSVLRAQFSFPSRQTPH